MSKNIEMNIMNNDNEYEVLYPKTLISNLILDNYLPVYKGGTGVGDLSSLKNNLNLRLNTYGQAQLSFTGDGSQNRFLDIDELANVYTYNKNYIITSYSISTTSFVTINNTELCNLHYVKFTLYSYFYYTDINNNVYPITTDNRNTSGALNVYRNDDGTGKVFVTGIFNLNEIGYIVNVSVMYIS